MCLIWRWVRRQRGQAETMVHECGGGDGGRGQKRGVARLKARKMPAAMKAGRLGRKASIVKKKGGDFSIAPAIWQRNSGQQLTMRAA